MSKADEKGVNLEEIAENPSLEERCIYPLGLTEDSLSAEEKVEQQFEYLNSVVNAVPADDIHVAISDEGDADGKGVVAIYKAKHKEGSTEVVWIPSSARDTSSDPKEMLERTIEEVPEGATVTFTDLAVNEEDAEEFLELFEKAAERFDFRIRDHHVWPPSVKQELPEQADVVIDSDQENPVCSTEIVVREDYPDAPEHIQELAEVTGVRDLWKEDHPEFNDRGQDITDFAYNCEFGEYPEVAAEYGADLREYDDVAELREEKNAKIEWVADQADWYKLTFEDPLYLGEHVKYDPEDGVFWFVPEDAEDDAEWIEIASPEQVDELPGEVKVATEATVAVTYGTSYPSGTGAELRDRGADVAGIVKPFGDVSWRASDEKPLARTFANLFNGGGHPPAAGCSPETVFRKQEFIGMIRDGTDPKEAQITTMERHWETEGELTKQVLIDGVVSEFATTVTKIEEPGQD